MSSPVKAIWRSLALFAIVIFKEEICFYQKNDRTSVLETVVISRVTKPFSGPGLSKSTGEFHPDSFGSETEFTTINFWHAKRDKNVLPICCRLTEGQQKVSLPNSCYLFCSFWGKCRSKKRSSGKNTSWKMLSSLFLNKHLVKNLHLLLLKTWFVKMWVLLFYICNNYNLLKNIFWVPPKSFICDRLGVGLWAREGKGNGVQFGEI